MRQSAVAVLIAASCLCAVNPSLAQTGRDLAALTDSQKTDYLGKAVETVAQFFQQEDGAAVRANCVSRWYKNDVAAANSFILKSTANFPDDDPVKVIVAMLQKQCGRDKAEGAQMLRDRVATKLAATEEATRQARLAAEGEKAVADEELRDIQRRAWRLPDGRRIYEDKDKSWRFEDGSIVPMELARKRLPPS